MICTCVSMSSCFRVINILVFVILNYLENVDVPAGIRLLITAVLSYLHPKSVFFSSSVERNMESTAFW